MPCECVRCKECEGTGNIWISFSGKYLGHNRCDDLDEMDTCPECDGDGLSELCDDCRERIEEEEQERAEWEKRLIEVRLDALTNI